MTWTCVWTYFLPYWLLSLHNPSLIIITLRRPWQPWLLPKLSSSGSLFRHVGRKFQVLKDILIYIWALRSIITCDSFSYGEGWQGISRKSSAIRDYRHNGSSSKKLYPFPISHILFICQDILDQFFSSSNFFSRVLQLFWGINSWRNVSEYENCVLNPI